MVELVLSVAAVALLSYVLGYRRRGIVERSRRGHAVDLTGRRPR